MINRETFRFKINMDNADAEQIYMANRHKDVYDIYVVNGIEYQRERVAAFIEKGDWIIV